MLKNIFLIALLASAVFTQDAVVTHYDLDGNVIAEEVQAVNEEVASPMMGDGNEMADKTELHSSPLNEISDAPQQSNQQSNDSMLDDGFDAPMMETDSLQAPKDANDQLIQSQVNLESEAQSKQQLDEQLNSQPDTWTSQVTSSDDITGTDLQTSIDDSANQAQDSTSNGWGQSEINQQESTTSAWEQADIVDTAKLTDDSLQSTESQDAWVQAETNLETEAEAEKAIKRKNTQPDSKLDEQNAAAQPNIAENVATKHEDKVHEGEEDSPHSDRDREKPNPGHEEQVNEGDEDVDSPHSDRDRDRPAPPGNEEKVNEDQNHSDRDREKPNGYEEGEEDHGLQQKDQQEHEGDDHDGHDGHDGHELQSTEQSAKNLVQGSCIIIYSQCQFKGDQMEVCQSLNEIEKFQHDIMSIYIPKGLGLTVYDSENFEGKSHKYTSSQNCLKYPLSFAQLSSKKSKKLSHNNLRRK